MIEKVGRVPFYSEINSHHNDLDAITSYLPEDSERRLAANK